MFSKRLDRIPPYLFVEINRKIAQKKAKGEEVISFAIGDPDIPTPDHIVKELCQAVRDPINHRYPETDGLPQLRQAISTWYKDRFGVDFDPDKEVLPLIGCKDGIGHIAFCLIDPGDIALVPDPGYPVYSMGTIMAGGEPHFMPLNEGNHYLPDLEAIPQSILKRAKLMWLNYPNNPTGAVAELNFFEKVIGFAKKHNVIVCHDAPYTEVTYDGYRTVSIMQVPGAKEIGIEFHSLSKTYNMTGWRIGMAVGNAKLINALFIVKSNLDSGIPQIIQLAAIKALLSSQECVSEHNVIYQRRRDELVNTLNEIGLKAKPPKASFYIWTKIPEGYTSEKFTLKLLEEAGVAVTPGTGYGKGGEGYIRFSLTVPDEQFKEGIKRLLAWGENQKR